MKRLAPSNLPLISPFPIIFLLTKIPRIFPVVESSCSELRCLSTEISFMYTRARYTAHWLLGLGGLDPEMKGGYDERC